MSNTIQTFLVTASEKAANELIAAINRIPADKLSWSPEGKARTALDQFAECTLLSRYTAEMIHKRAWLDSNFASYAKEKSDLEALGVPEMTKQLQANTRLVTDAIRSVPDDALSIEIQMPWNKSTLAEILAYPYWNMSYHLGQINYIASMLGCLE